MLPKTIKLLEKEYDIFELYYHEDSPLQIGEIEEHNDIIRISPRQSTSNQHITIFHEIVHAIFEQTGHSNYDNDEDLVDCVALGIYSLIKHNDFSFMKEDDERVECVCED